MANTYNNRETPDFVVIKTDNNIDVRKHNKKAFDIYSLYCDFLYEDELNYYFEFKKENFSKFTDKFKNKILNNFYILL